MDLLTRLLESNWFGFSSASEFLCPGVDRTHFMGVSKKEKKQKFYYSVAPAAAKVLKSLVKKGMITISHGSIYLSNKGRKHAKPTELIVPRDAKSYGLERRKEDRIAKRKRLQLKSVQMDGDDD